MPPSRSILDPEGYYAQLGLTPEASRTAIAAAYRAKARVLHPDVPNTGNAPAFLALKQAYDVLSSVQQRGEYDRKARRATERFAQPPPSASPIFTARPAAAETVIDETHVSPLPKLPDMPMVTWIAIGVVLAICVIEIMLHLIGGTDAPEKIVSVPPTAASVQPLTPAQDTEMRYGPAPLHLPGVANFYVTPADGPAILYRLQPDHHTLVPEARLPPFSSVQAVRLYTQAGMIQVLTGNGTAGFVQVAHLSPGGLAAARTAYCGYNAGTSPEDGEVLDQSGTGTGTLRIDNRSIEPAVVRLRDPAGAVVVSVYLSPGKSTAVEGLQAGEFRPEYAIGELWSRACNGFATGMQAWRLARTVRLPGPASIVVTNDVSPPAGTGISQDVFESK